MCTRFTIFTYDEALDIVEKIECFSPLNIEPDWPARRIEAFPESTVPIIVPHFDTMDETPAITSGTLDVRELSWGFEQSWKPGVVFNTRIESAAKPMWRDSMEHRRCLIPAISFFETHHNETFPSPQTGKPIKRPYEFNVVDQDVVLIGGIWRGSSFSMVTTEANADMSPIHPRMPLVLRPNEVPLWLGPNYARLADRSSVRLNAHPLSQIHCQESLFQ